MAFTKKIPEWNASGVEPPQSLKDSGWKPGVKPAADHFNWLQTTASEAIKELQQKAGEVKKVNGQLPDANGNVNVNIDTSKLATKEELNSASTYIQQEMNDLEQTVGAHQTDLESQESGKGASLIGINDSSNLLTATTVEGALAEVMTKANSAFQSASDGKTLVANAITAKGQTASGNDTFAQLATAIGNISTGKKWASGTLTTNSSGTFSVSNLAFSPNLVFVKVANKGDSDNNGFGMYSKVPGLTFSLSFNSGTNTYALTFNNNGFAYNNTVIFPSSTILNWYALEI